jgi:hypothetical protein
MAKLKDASRSRQGAVGARAYDFVLCLPARRDWQHVGGGGEAVTGMVIKGLIE